MRISDWSSDVCSSDLTYCSSSFLGICKTRRTAYCCFESKLSRILQEQGRIQLSKPWGAPNKEQCLGFTIEEFARLDLSLMDFTEVYDEFVDASRIQTGRASGWERVCQHV